MAQIAEQKRINEEKERLAREAEAREKKRLAQIAEQKRINEEKERLAREAEARKDAEEKALIEAEEKTRKKAEEKAKLVVKKLAEEATKLREERLLERLERLRDALSNAKDKEAVEAILVLIPGEEGEEFKKLKMEAREKAQSFHSVDSENEGTDWHSEYNYSHRPDENESDQDEWQASCVYSHRQDDQENNSALQGNWTSHLDEASGHIYYQNSSTGETTWDKQEGFVDSETEAIGGTPEWSEVIDPGSGHPYYYNNVTGESSWDKPSNFEKNSSKHGLQKPAVGIFQRIANKI